MLVFHLGQPRGAGICLLPALTVSPLPVLPDSSLPFWLPDRCEEGGVQQEEAGEVKRWEAPGAREGLPVSSAFD